MPEEDIIGKTLDYFFTGKEKAKIEHYENIAITTKKTQEYNKESKCDWCEDTGFCTLYELI